MKPGAAPSVSRIGRFFLDSLEEFVFPPFCVLCDDRMARGTRFLCARCERVLRSDSRDRDSCPRCAQNRANRQCACEFAFDHPFEKMFAVFDYDDRCRKLVHEIKYRGLRNLAYDLGIRFSTEIPPEFTDGIQWITAPPLHFFRRMRRGYNQAEWLARGFASGLGMKDRILSDAIRRTRHTKTQTKLDRTQRLKNPSGAFAPRAGKCELLKGCSVLLVDDVVTTGATIAECTRALLSGGAREVRVLCLGRD